MSAERRRFGQTLSSVTYTYDRVYDKRFSNCLFLEDRLSRVKNLYRKDLKAHFGCVNAIEFSADEGTWFASGGDDRRVLIWDTEKAIDGAGSPKAMKGDHFSNIFCLAFDNSNQKVLSGGNDEQVILHDIETGETLDVFLHQEAVYSLSVDPLNDHVFASACDDGRILVYDTRAPPSEDPFCLAHHAAPMHSVMFNPSEPRLVATANSKQGLGLWDIRKPRSRVLKYGGANSSHSCMSVRFNRQGSSLVALRRRLPPVLYNVHSEKPVFQFDHPGYYNSCTMKSCCFAGVRDQYVLSGSDDFNLYMWKIPEEPRECCWVGEAHLVLKGHRSIVNQVRWNSTSHVILSSGVEKVIKLWSSFPVPACEGDLGPGWSPKTTAQDDRPAYTHEEYINLVLHGGQVMSHDYTQQSMEEDPRMMAFFDSLVQRELEGWSSGDGLESEPELLSRYRLTVDSGRSAGSASGSAAEGPGAEDSEDEEEEEDEDENEDDDDDDDDDGNAAGFIPFNIAFASVMARREGIDPGVGDNLLAHVDGLGSARGLSEAGPGTEADEAFAAAVAPPLGAALDILPGQRPSTSRVSIANLISQKRQEYLASARQAEKRTRKSQRLKRKLLCSAAKAKKIRVAQFAPSSSSSEANAVVSSSESDAEATTVPEANISTRSFSPTPSSSTSVSPSHSSRSPSASPAGSPRPLTDVFRALSQQRKQQTRELNRLKRLRGRVLRSDSDSDSSPPGGGAGCPGTSTCMTSCPACGGAEPNDECVCRQPANGRQLPSDACISVTDSRQSSTYLLGSDQSRPNNGTFSSPSFRRNAPPLCDVIEEARDASPLSALLYPNGNSSASERDANLTLLGDDIATHERPPSPRGALPCHCSLSCQSVAARDTSSDADSPGGRNDNPPDASCTYGATGNGRHLTAPWTGGACCRHGNNAACEESKDSKLNGRKSWGKRGKRKRTKRHYRRRSRLSDSASSEDD